MRTTHLYGTALAAALAAPVTVEAQRATDDVHPGLAWVGCWEPFDGLPGSVMTCIAPVGANTLKITAIGSGGSLTESSLVIDGQRREITAGGCTGWETAKPSADGDRIFVDGEVSCPDLPTQRRTGAFVIAPNGDWLHIEGAGIRMVNSAGVRRYRQVTNYLTIPLPVRDVVRTWLEAAELERAEVMTASLSAKDLLEMDAEEVPVPVIDVMVASAHPQAFVLEATSVSARPPYTRSPSETPTPVYAAGMWPVFGFYDSFALQNCMHLAGTRSLYTANCFDPWGPFGYYSSRYGWGGWGGLGGGYIPVTVIPTTPGRGDRGDSGGRVVRGRGYTQPDNDGPSRGTAQPRASMPVGAPSGASAGAQGSPSSSGGGSSASGGEQRTAKPRNP